MAGLLDVLSTPESALGLGLLAAANSGQGFGQGLLQASQYANQVRSSKEEQELQKLYRTAQIQDIQRKSIADARRQALEADFLGLPTPGGYGSATSAAPATGLLAAASGGQSAAQPSGQSVVGSGAGGRLEQISQQYGIPREALQADFLYNGGKKIAELVSKAAEPNWVNVGGNLVNTRAPGFQGGIQDQVSISNDGRATVLRANGGNPVVGAPAGALDTYAAYQNINNASNAAFTPERIYNPATQREEIMPRSRVLQGASQRGLSGPGYAGGSRDGANAESIRMIEREMQNPNLRAGDREALQREMQRLQQQSGMPQSGNYAAGPSAGELAANEAARARAVGTANADVVRDTGRQSENKLSSKLNAGVDRALQLLNSGPTASVFGNLADKGLGAFGVSTPGGETAAQLETLSGWLVSNVPRMEGPQSNMDVINYQTMAGRIGDRNLPIGVRQKAAEEVKRLQNKYSELNGGPASETQSATPRATMRFNPQTGRLEKVN